MKKSDLKSGNVVENRKGIKYLYHYKNSDQFLNLDYDAFLWICNFDENLKCINYLNEFDIMKVYKDYTCKELLWERKEKKLVISEDEKAILRNVPKHYKWIARDLNGHLYIYVSKPKKGLTIWVNTGLPMVSFDHLFRFIKYEDKEPYSIEKLLKGEEK